MGKLGKPGKMSEKFYQANDTRRLKRCTETRVTVTVKVEVFQDKKSQELKSIQVTGSPKPRLEGLLQQSKE